MRMLRVLKVLPNENTTLLRRLINVNDADSTSQQRRVPSGLRFYVGTFLDLMVSKGFKGI